MRTQVIKISHWLVEGGILLAVFLIPLLFLPFISELGTFEFSKQMVLYLIVGIMFFFWTLRMVLEEKVELPRTGADFFILLFLVVFLIATAFSFRPWTSVWGDHPRLHGGLISVIVYALFFLLTVSHIREKRGFSRLLWAVLVSAGILSAVGLLRFFRIDAGIVDFRESVWALIGSGRSAAVWLTMLAPLLFASLFLEGRQSRRILLIVLGMVLSGYLGFLGFLPSLVVFVAGALFFLACLIVKRVAFTRIHAVSFGLIFLIFFLTAGVSNIPSIKGRIPYVKDVTPPSEITLDHKTSWIIVLGGFNFPKNIFLGSGPATYLSDFLRFRPITFNTTPFWNLQFTRASNEVFQMLSTIGLLGFLGFLLVFLFPFRWFFREFWKKMGGGEETVIVLGILTCLINFLLLVFVSSTVTATMLYAWLLLALFFCALNLFWKKEAFGTVLLSLSAIPLMNDLMSDKLKKREVLTWIIFGFTTIFLFVFLFFMAKYVLADIAYRNTEGADTVRTAITNSTRAVSLFPQNEQYRIVRARTALASAVAFTRENQDLTPEEEQDLITLLMVARDEANAAVNLAPLSSSAWETRGDVFLALAARFGVKGAEDEAVLSYSRARQFSPTIFLDPINPRYPNLIGFIQLQFKEDMNLAQQNIITALNLKPAYAAAFYNSAQLLKRRGEFEQAKTVLDRILQRYDSLDPQELLDLGISKEQLQKERDSLAISSSQPEGEE